MSAELEPIKAQIRTFFARHIPNHTVADDEDIFAAGYVSSLFVMQMVLYCEKTFDVTFLSEDLDLDNFKSIAAAARLVAKRQATVEASGLNAGL